MNLQQRTVLPLPSELRNRVYTLLLCDTYRSPPSNRQAEPIINLANLAILRVSKATSKEALGILYSQSTFKSNIDCDDTSKYSSPSINAAAKIQRVAIEVSGNFIELANDAIRAVVHSIVAVFGPISIVRDSILVKFRLAGENYSWLFPGILLATLCKQLNFRIFNIEFSLASSAMATTASLSTSNWLNRKMQYESAEVRKYRKLPQDTTKKLLEDHCGPAVKEAVGYLESHPFEHSAERLIVTAKKAIEVAAEDMRQDTEELKALV